MSAVLLWISNRFAHPVLERRTFGVITDWCDGLLPASSEPQPVADHWELSQVSQSSFRGGLLTTALKFLRLRPRSISAEAADAS